MRTINTVNPINPVKIKVGKFNPNYPINKLKVAKVNRDLVENHSESFKAKLIEYGWMMPIVISEEGDLIEGHHRLMSAILLNQDTIPVYMVDWVDTNKDKEHLDTIISINNGNKAWNTLDFLKAYIPFNEDYKKVYDIYEKNSNNITVGNIVNCYFGLSDAGSRQFKKGNAKIKDIKFSDYILSQLTNLDQKYGKSKIAAYCVRELIKVAFIKTKRDVKAMEYLFKQYRKMAKENHPGISSIYNFRPILELDLSYYYKICDNKK